MKRICFLINKLTDGGAERVTSVIANCLAEKEKYEIIVATLEEREKEYSLKSTVKRVKVQLPRANRGLGVVLNFIAIRQKLIEMKCDCYIGIDVYANLLVSFLGMTSMCRTIISERNAPKQVKLRRINKILRKILYPFANKIVFQTQGAMNDSGGILKNKGVIIPNPIIDDLPFYNPKKKVICAAGRLVEEKNYKLLIDAFEKVHQLHPEYKLSIYGQGWLKEELDDYIKKLNLGDNVVLEGYYEDVHNMIKENQIFVLSSNYEGLPNALMEAMAMGFPVISTDCPPGGPRTLIRSGENGYLVPVNDREKLFKKLNYLVENESKRKLLSENAKLIRREYSSEHISKQWEIVIERILDDEK